MAQYLHVYNNYIYMFLQVYQFCSVYSSVLMVFKHNFEEFNLRTTFRYVLSIGTVVIISVPTYFWCTANYTVMYILLSVITFSHKMMQFSCIIHHFTPSQSSYFVLSSYISTFCIFIQKCYSILGVKTDSDQETVRQAFLQLVKRFHPDSGTNEANSEKFQEVRNMFNNYRHRKSYSKN